MRRSMPLSGKEALRVEEGQTHCSPFLNAGVATVDKSSIDEGIAQFMLTKRLLQDHLEQGSSRL